MNFFTSGYIAQLLNASVNTLALAVTSLVFGLILGALFTMGEMSKCKWVAIPTSTLVTMLRGLPELLIVLFIYFGSSQLIFLLTDSFIEVSSFVAGVIALSLIFASYASQTMRGALKAVDVGQLYAARSLGISRERTFFKIILPQAAIHAIPGLSNQWLVLLKDTALVSLIGVIELLKGAQLITASTHNSFIWYAGVALIYLVITLISQFFILKLNHKLAIPGVGE